MGDVEQPSQGDNAGVRARHLRIRSASTYGGRGPSLPRALRAASTPAESVLWHHLRNRRLAGAKFRRQQALGPYVVDFYCHQHSLIIEVDGSQHYDADQSTKDRQRSDWLESKGLRVLRFNNREVLGETELVLEQIQRVIEERTPGASQQGG